MAFDWTKLEGYREDMTGDEKLALLDAYEPEPSAKPENVVAKAQFDKVSSELASLKKQMRSKMTEDEQREADRAAADAAKDEELNTLRREKMLNSYKASYLAQGYDEKLADESAVAMADGDMDAVFAIMKKHAANVEKEIRAKILKETPVPPSGDSGGELTDAEKYAKRAGEAKAAADKLARDTLAKYY